MHSISGSIYNRDGGREGRIFPIPAFERLQQVSGTTLSSIFAFFPAGNMNVMIKRPGGVGARDALRHLGGVDGDHRS